MKSIITSIMACLLFSISFAGNINDAIVEWLYIGGTQLQVKIDKKADFYRYDHAGGINSQIEDVAAS